MPPAIYPVTCANMNPQFDYAVANRLEVAKVFKFNLAQPTCNSRFCNFVAEVAKPFGIWFVPVLLLVTDDFDHGRIVA